MTKEEYEKNKEKKEKKKSKRIFLSIVKRSLVTIIICLSILIIVNNNDSAREFIEKYLFNSTFKFSKINNFFNQYLLNKNNEEDNIPVMKVENLLYLDIKEYGSGAILTMNDNSNIKLFDSGIIVFIGEKEEYGNTIIVQQSNGIDTWYGNVKDVNVKLYDYVEKDTIIGSSNKNLYLLFEKEGEYLDYKEFVK